MNCCLQIRPDCCSASEVSVSKKAMSRSHADRGNTSKSQIILRDEEAIEQALKTVWSDENDWILLQYVEGTRDEIELVSSGHSLASLSSAMPANDIRFAFLKQNVKMEGAIQDVTKYLLITWVPDTVSPLKRAKTGSHRTELAEFISGLGSFHSHYQAAQPDDLLVDNILAKLAYG